VSSSSVDVELVLKLRDTASAGLQTASNAARQAAGQAATATARAAQQAAAAAEAGAARQGRSHQGAGQQARSEAAATATATARAAQQAAAAAEAGAARQGRSHQGAGQQARSEAAATATATERAAQQAATAAQAGATRQRAGFTALAQARQQLGIRSEHSIQREIQRTEAAYNRLAGAGRLSADQQARAYDAMRQKVTALTNEMGKLTAQQQRSAQAARGQQMLRTGAAAVAGVAAAAYTMKAPAQAAMAFDERLAHMANAAYAERDKEGRKIGMQELEGAINKAVGEGGGTREQAADALDKLLASGTVGQSEALAMLPQLMRFATASNTDATELAQIGIRGMQTFGIDAADLPNMLNMAIAAGQAGGFELSDMAKWLPQQMAAASMSGLKGREGFAKIAALNQAAAITAGTTDEAGNNVKDLLLKINSGTTANNAKKLGYNLPKYLQEQQSQGVDSIDAFAALVQNSVAKRSDYKALQKQLQAATTNDEKRATLESMAQVAQGAGIGKVIQDQQALMALLGMMNNREYMQGVLQTVRDNDVASGGAGDKNYEVISETTSFKARQAAQQMEIGQKAAMDSLTPAIGRAADAFAGLAAKYPTMVGAVSLATPALGALAGAAGLASLAMGGGVGGGKGKGLPGTAALGRAAEWASASKVGRMAMKAGKVGSVAGLASEVGGWALGKGFGEDSAIARYGSSAMSGAAMGATLGSIIPVLGTGIGAAAGGAIGLAWEGIKDLMKPAEPQPQPPVDVAVKLSVDLAPGQVLQSQSVQASGAGRVYTDTGNLSTGAP